MLLGKRTDGFCSSLNMKNCSLIFHLTCFENISNKKNYKLIVICINFCFIAQDFQKWLRNSKIWFKNWMYFPRIWTPFEIVCRIELTRNVTVVFPDPSQCRTELWAIPKFGFRNFLWNWGENKFFSFPDFSLQVAGKILLSWQKTDILILLEKKKLKT